MSITICGDIHGTKDIGKLYQYFAGKDVAYSKEDYLIICGDVGVCGFDPQDENETRKTLHEFPVTVLFCDGNHENFDELNDFPESMWKGGKIHLIEPDIIHLMRGQIYTLEGKIFFVFGGAYSEDRNTRVKGFTWYEEEIPIDEEYKEGWRNLEDKDFKVDYIITHTGPNEVCAEMGYGCYDEAQKQAQEFQEIADRVEFKDWYFGHFHEDENIEEFHCLWDEIVEV